MQTGVRVFQRPGSVFGARCSVLGVDPVPGTRCQVPDTWYPGPGTRWNARLTLRKTRTLGMQDAIEFDLFSICRS